MSVVDELWLTLCEVQFVMVESRSCQPTVGAGLPWATHTIRTEELVLTVLLRVVTTILALVPLVLSVFRIW